MRRNPEFHAWLLRHAGVFRRSDALGCGLTARQFRTGVDQESWSQFRGVWIVAYAPQDRSAVHWAGLLKGGAQARLTGVSALSIRGLSVGPQGPQLSIPADCRVNVPGATVLRDRCRDGSNVTFQGYPSVTRQRAIVDALRVLNLKQGREVLHEVLRRNWMTVPELEHWSVRLRGHKGMAVFRQQLAYARSGSRAESEFVLQRMLRAQRITGWRLNDEIYGADGQLLGIGDCVHRAARVVVELDGHAWHTSVDRFQRDRTRQNRISNAGWRVLRFTWTDITDGRAEMIAAMRAVVAERLGKL